METVLHGIAQIKKATGIATVGAWILLGLAYAAALAFGTVSTFSLQLFQNLFGKSIGEVLLPVTFLVLKKPAGGKTAASIVFASTG